METGVQREPQLVLNLSWFLISGENTNIRACKKKKKNFNPHFNKRSGALSLKSAFWDSFGLLLNHLLAAFLYLSDTNGRDYRWKASERSYMLE